MAFQFKILASSSSGNCSLLQTDKATVLIDVGFSAKKVCEMLAGHGLAIENVDAVFLTHEHSDHAAGVRGLAKHEHLKFFANKDTADKIQNSIKKQARWTYFESGTTFKFEDLEVHAFSVPHDAYDPVGFVFEWGGDDLFNPRRSLAWATDLGYMPVSISQKIKNVDILVLESNYDNDLLEEDEKRPWPVKQRIRSRHGHLSNEDALKALDEIDNPRWQKLVLAHISKDCNCTQRVERLFQSVKTRIPHLDLSIIDPLGGQLTIDNF